LTTKQGLGAAPISVRVGSLLMPAIAACLSRFEPDPLAAPPKVRDEFLRS